MAFVFAEPGGDSDFGIGLWPNNVGTPSVATDFVHGGHIKSIKYATGVSNYLLGSNKLSDAGGRFSGWFYFNALPTVQANVFLVEGAGDGAPEVGIHLKPTGVIFLIQNDNVTQIGSDGPTLTTGKWYRISYCWTVTSSTVNQLRLYVFDSDGVTSLGTISVTNATLQSTGIADFLVGNGSGDATFDLRSSDHYIDNSTALTDPGNIWVTAKRPIANGTANGFTTQIGSGGSGYGTGHAPQVNERPESDTNGWSIATTSSTTVNEEYNIESASQGDINITGASIVGVMGWVCGNLSSTTSQTAGIIVDGTYTAKTVWVTSGHSFFTQVSPNPTTYPAGIGTDIGMRKVTTTTTSRTGRLFECGIVVAYIPAAVGVTAHNLTLLGVGA